jgi:hypothetical protein
MNEMLLGMLVGLGWKPFMANMKTSKELAGGGQGAPGGGIPPEVRNPRRPPRRRCRSPPCPRGLGRRRNPERRRFRAGARRWRYPRCSRAFRAGR